MPSSRVLGAIALALTSLATAAAPASGAPLLPDLDQAAPDQLVVQQAGSEWHLGFRSRTTNVGQGRLTIRGHRPDTSGIYMQADQILTDAAGGETTRPGVGRMLYVDNPTHHHWHFERFETYGLRRVSDFGLVAPDRKTGFCLVDGFATGNQRYVDGWAEGAYFRSDCRWGEPEALTAELGISPGYGDQYEPVREGQYVDLTNVRAGRYYLVHQNNPDRKLLESSYANNESSVLVDVAWPRGRTAAPRVTPLITCPETKKCSDKLAARLVRSDSRSLTLEMTVPDAGALEVQALAGRKAVGRSSRRTKRTGVVSVRVPLDRSARAKLARGRLSLQVASSFRPKRGKPQRNRVKLALRRAQGGAAVTYTARTAEGPTSRASGKPARVLSRSAAGGELSPYLCRLGSRATPRG